MSAREPKLQLPVIDPRSVVLVIGGGRAEAVTSGCCRQVLVVVTQPVRFAGKPKPVAVPTRPNWPIDIVIQDARRGTVGIVEAPKSNAQMDEHLVGENGVIQG